jgi:hypothetical protein
MTSPCIFASYLRTYFGQDITACIRYGDIVGMCWQYCVRRQEKILLLEYKAV